MSQAQVLQAFPSATTPIEKETIKSGASCELAIPNYVISSDNYRVCFYFAADKLVQVMLSAQTPSRTQFEILLSLLRSKYGRELGSGDNPCTVDGYTKCSADWVLPSGTNVSATYYELGNASILNVNYQTRMAADASNL